MRTSRRIFFFDLNSSRNSIYSRTTRMGLRGEEVGGGCYAALKSGDLGISLVGT